MLEVYWGCLIGGIIFSLLTLLLGDLMGHGGHEIPHAHPDHDGGGFLKPAVIVSAIAAFGGAGIMLTRYSTLSTLPMISIAVAVAALIAVGVYFLYYKPMRNSENSVAYSMEDLKGKIGEVITPIPEVGYGEVMMKVGASNTCQIAASFEGALIRTGTKVVVVDADRDTLYVTPIETT